MLHVIGDIGASIGVIVAGGVILLTGWYYADPLISLGIAALIAWGALRMVSDTANVLLEGAPSDLDLAQVRATILKADGIASVHDPHVWSLDAEQLALSCHVVPEDLYTADGEHLLRRLEQQLCERFEVGPSSSSPWGAFIRPLPREGDRGEQPTAGLIAPTSSSLPLSIRQATPSRLIAVVTQLVSDPADLM